MKQLYHIHRSYEIISILILGHTRRQSRGRSTVATSGVQTEREGGRERGRERRERGGRERGRERDREGESNSNFRFLSFHRFSPY